ncbi:unnamed protein product [Didymodactylos carnosus]|uniref:Uncharacterized protein n=1 Tax=Didymodactylos carnosus TaxID=1234261 RepID=A0A813UJU4_9BILA|nr:unnamed protein product [Didymodactylos carnosus]CAF0826959.1 unnamed protein product [Didymodactylos carnosus]CAF3557255.1 unnamed protein product [Didymodactylos carnosus]CAF3613830.1 unnamed protein product [Didymodactylos carnosus]
MNFGISIELTSILYSSNRQKKNDENILSLSLQHQQLSSFTNTKFQPLLRRSNVKKSSISTGRIANKQEYQQPPSATLFLRSSTPKSTLKVIREHLNESIHSKKARLSSPTPSPRCSTPWYSKQHRTRPYIVCELCRQKAVMSVVDTSLSANISKVKKKHTTFNSTKMHQNYPKLVKKSRRSSMNQLLVWIL